MANTVSTKISLDGGKSFAQALKDIALQAKTMDSETRAAASAVNANASAQSKAAIQAEALSKRIDEQRKIVDRLRAVMEDSIAQNGENAAATQRARIAYNDAVTSLNSMERQLDETTGELEEYNKGAQSAAKNSNGFKDAMSAAGKVVGNVAAGIAKAAAAITAVAAAMAGAAAAAFGKLVKSSVQAFGELEQNLGGSEAVFGEYAKEVQRLGEDAYRTMGTTQSEYLATANKMGALFQGSGLDVQRSMELSTQAMQRATDMASVMGIDVGSALEAVTGAAKGNYTMMDNLGVAMNATTLEAYAVSKGIDTAWKSMTNAEKAELAMQYFFENTAQYAGNFEREATQTITGSFGLLQASVQSLVAGFGNSEADIRKLTANVGKAFGAVVQNVTPVVKNIIAALPQAMGEIQNALVELAPVVIEAAGLIIDTLLASLSQFTPQLLAIAASLMTWLSDAILDNLPAILTAASGIIMSLARGIISYLPQISAVAIDVILMLVDGLLTGDSLGQLLSGAGQIIMHLVSGLIDAAPEILSGAEALIGDLLNGLADGIPQLIDMALELVFAILNGLTNPESLSSMIRGALRLVVELAKGLVRAIPEIAARLPEIIASIVKTLISLAPELITAAIEIIAQLIVGLVQAIPLLVKMIPDIINAMVDAFSGFDWSSIGKNIMEGIKNGLRNMVTNLVNTVKDIGRNLLSSAKKVLGIASPSKEFEKVGDFIGLGLDKGMEKSLAAAARNMQHDLAAMPLAATATLEAAAAGGVSRSYNFGAVNFSVYAAEGQDARSLARQVEEIFMADLRAREGAFA